MTRKKHFGVEETRQYRTFDDLKEADLEFQEGRLAKAKGHRPTDLDGWELINLSHALARLLYARMPKPDHPDLAEINEWNYLQQGN